MKLLEITVTKEMLNHLRCILLFVFLKLRNSIVEIEFVSIYSAKIAISNYREKNRKLLFFSIIEKK